MTKTKIRGLGRMNMLARRSNELSCEGCHGWPWTCTCCRTPLDLGEWMKSIAERIIKKAESHDDG